MIIQNDQALIIQGISERLMHVYAAELICLVLGHYTGSHWYGIKRDQLHKILREQLNETSSIRL